MNDQKKKAAIIAVRTKQRQLKMIDEDYRAMLFARTGNHSTKECTLEQLGVVNDYLTSLGAIDPNGANADGKKRGRVAAEKQALVAKVHQQLASLRELNGNKSGTYTLSYVDAICKKNDWCTRFDFANVPVLHRLVGALERTLKFAQQRVNRAT